jgi:competence protein ComEA
VAFLVGVATTLLFVQVVGSLRWSARPTELDRDLGSMYRIDLNQADRAELLQLPGVGEHLAQRIEAYRREHGAFHHLNELTQVQGVGPSTLEKLRSWVRIDSETSETANTVPGRKDTRKAVGTKEATLTTPIDVNRATEAELQRLPGIGPKRAQQIVAERAKTPFRSVEELRRVTGIGPKTLDRLRPYVLVQSAATPVAQAD